MTSICLRPNIRMTETTRYNPPTIANPEYESPIFEDKYKAAQQLKKKMQEIDAKINNTIATTDDPADAILSVICNFINSILVFK